jgi:AcrR family transcriptional regulator
MVNLKFTEPIHELVNSMESNPSLSAGLIGYIGQYLEYWNNHKRELLLYFLTMNESFKSKQLMDLFKETTRKIFDCFERQFIRGQDAGIFKRGDARARAIALVSCLDGYLGYMLIDESLSPETLKYEVQRLFVDEWITDSNNIIIIQ